jgi:hypothetical protein
MACSSRGREFDYDRVIARSSSHHTSVLGLSSHFFGVPTAKVPVKSAFLGLRAHSTIELMILPADLPREFAPTECRQSAVNMPRLLQGVFMSASAQSAKARQAPYVSGQPILTGVVSRTELTAQPSGSAILHIAWAILVISVISTLAWTIFLVWNAAANILGAIT